jgi:hypothetical protein
MSKKLTIEFVREEFLKEGYILLDTEYINNLQKLDYICPEGHRHSVSWNKWTQIRRCPICSSKKKLTIKFIRSEFKKERYELLTEEYVNNKQNLDYICPEGHKHSVSWHNWQAGSQRCPTCRRREVSKLQRHSLDYIKNFFAKEGYTLLSDSYKHCHQKLDYICPEGHRHSMSWNNFRQGCRCPQEAHNHSKAENEIYDFIKSYCSDTEQGNRELIKPLELDIIIPSKKLAIEYCGLYWHSEQNGKDKNYHLNKLNLCNEAEYDLITIFEDEYINKKDIVLKRLLYKLNLSDSERVYARNCEIREIDTKTKNKFLNKYHIQGKDNSSIKLGAFYNDKLVSVMTFSKGNISKGSKNIEGIYELNRFCSDYNYTVVGIAGKLFKYFTIKYESMEVFSYADKRWGSGSFYENLGFKFCYNTEPNYWYVVEDKRVHRFNFRKDVLSEKLEIFDPELTEVENMENNGYVRIFDCGNSKYLI